MWKNLCLVFLMHDKINKGFGMKITSTLLLNVKTLISHWDQRIRVFRSESKGYVYFTQTKG
jgi:hypothetical protein